VIIQLLSLFKSYFLKKKFKSLIIIRFSFIKLIKNLSRFKNKR
jgi:hypothetical protein